jgi:glycosyltransferase involved in cell wall biosynthesis
MRVGFVVQRYGEEVAGGAEALCRSVAERLNRFARIEVLTTTALDHHTWAGHYRAGESELNGVRVQRFPVIRSRNPAAFRRQSEQLFNYPHTPLDEIAWMEAQGPQVPELMTYLHKNRQEYDAFAFFTYLYYTTYFGLQIAPEKSILVPTAHDESPIYLDIFRPMFRAPKAIVYLTDAERRFVQSHFDVGHIPCTVTGMGMESIPQADPARFRERYGIDGPFILYTGRIELSKSCDTLFDYFMRYRHEYGEELKLVLLGKAGMNIPDDPDIRFLGFVSEQDKFDALRAADIFVLPSRFESLSIASLEAWQVATPILADGQSEVMKEHCIHSNGGLYYYSYDEFATSVRLLMSRPRLRTALGEAGRDYVNAQYGWSQIEASYLRILESVTNESRSQVDLP